ncbi:MAG: acyl-CoA thioesterase [Myxococcota bacterium]
MSARLCETSIELEVPFHDVDVTRRVWHGHYYKYLELARTALFRACRLDDEELFPKRWGLFVVETHCRYVYPLRYGDRISVSAWFRDIDHRLAVGYVVRNLSQDHRAAVGRTVLVTVDTNGRMLLETPREIRERITETADQAR